MWKYLNTNTFKSISNTNTFSLAHDVTLNLRVLFIAYEKYEVLKIDICVKQNLSSWNIFPLMLKNLLTDEDPAGMHKILNPP